MFVRVTFWNHNLMTSSRRYRWQYSQTDIDILGDTYIQIKVTTTCSFESCASMIWNNKSTTLLSKCILTKDEFNMLNFSQLADNWSPAIQLWKFEPCISCISSLQKKQKWECCEMNPLKICIRGKKHSTRFFKYFHEYVSLHLDLFASVRP